MKAFLKGCFGVAERYGHHKVFICFIVLISLAAGTAAISLTKEEVQKVEIHKINEADVRVRNIGCRRETLNPLRHEEDADLSSAVKGYFENEKKDETFVEKYDDVRIHTKVGEYKDTYVVFAEYRMKIKDIYTEVPGLVTLYAVKDEKSGMYQIGTEVPEGQDQEYVGVLAGHADIQVLQKKAEEEFESAVYSDAILRESLADLKNAYSVSAG